MPRNRYAITTEEGLGWNRHCIHKADHDYDREVYCVSLVDALFVCKALNELSDEAYDRLRREAIAEANRKMEDAA